ncbi:MAG TPA: hypothetical protein VNN17_02065 [Terriglobia bacterium]|nr:hypothetical protein [Terriglobia bacterium]
MRGAVPPARDILLVESGSPQAFRQGLVNIRQSFPETRLQLLTCWPEPAQNVFSSIYRVQEYASRREKLALLFSLRKNPPDVLGILCSNDPIMYSWKLLATLVLPAKVLIINENGDFFWLDWQNRKALRRFLQSRWVIIRKEFLLTLLRGMVFPLTFLYLLLHAGWLYLRRWRRLALWRIQGGGLRKGKPEAL